MFKKYDLEIIAFTGGAVVMVLELVGSRILAPHLGTSIIVWTGLIGVILGSLSIGYSLGGRLADQKPNRYILSLIIFASSVTIGTIVVLRDIVLDMAVELESMRFGVLLATLILFSPSSILLGMVTPYVARLKVDNIGTSGRTVGNLYAISTFGSIAGTFLAGFYLIPSFGSTKLLAILSIILFLTSLFSYFLENKEIDTIRIVAIIFLYSLISGQRIMAQKDADTIDVDTKYNRVIIYEAIDPATNRPIRILKDGIHGLQSAMFIDRDDELVFEYTKYFRLGSHFVPEIKKGLMIGGCAYSYPKDFLKKYADSRIDVVEIDPGMTELAKKYFNLKDDPRLKIYHEDGRVFLNSIENKYDIIYIDAFSAANAMPFQLATREAVQKIYEKLNEGGAVMLNIISSFEGEKGKFLRAEYATYRSIFPQVYLFAINDNYYGLEPQNIILLALKTEKKPELKNASPELNRYLENIWDKKIREDTPILTDDFAPVENYNIKLIDK